MSKARNNVTLELRGEDWNKLMTGLDSWQRRITSHTNPSRSAEERALGELTLEKPSGSAKDLVEVDFTPDEFDVLLKGFATLKARIRSKDPNTEERILTPEELALYRRVHAIAIQVQLAMHGLDAFEA